MVKYDLNLLLAELYEYLAVKKIWGLIDNPEYVRDMDCERLMENIEVQIKELKKVQER